MASIFGTSASDLLAGTGASDMVSGGPEGDPAADLGDDTLRGLGGGG